MNKLRTIIRIERHIQWLDKHILPELQAIRDTLIEYRSMLNIPSTPDEIESANADIIIDVVAEYYHIELTEMIGISRKRIYVTARHQAAWMLRKHTNLFLDDIGKLLGNRHHSTAIHSIRYTQDMIDIEDREYLEALTFMNRSLKEKTAQWSRINQSISITEKQAS